MRPQDRVAAPTLSERAAKHEQRDAVGSRDDEREDEQYHGERGIGADGDGTRIDLQDVPEHADEDQHHEQRRHAYDLAQKAIDPHGER